MKRMIIRASANTVTVFLIFVLTGCVASSVNNQVPVGTAGTTESRTQHFPSVSMADLDGKTYLAPTEFPAQKSVLILGFAHAQQEQVAAWYVALREALGQSHASSIFEVPVFNTSSLTFRTMVRNAMRMGSSSEERARTLTLFVDRDGFTKALSIEDLSAPTVLVVNREGRVLESAHGEVAPEKVEALSLKMVEP